MSNVPVARPAASAAKPPPSVHAPVDALRMVRWTETVVIDAVPEEEEPPIPPITIEPVHTVQIAVDESSDVMPIDIAPLQIEPLQGQ